jgi:hypothetical protein
MILSFTPIGLPTVCYQIGFDGAGKPVFTLVGQTQVVSAGRVGVGIPTVTTYKGQAGTGILWVTDVNLGLRAFNAVPVNNVLVPISLPALPGLAKFQRPVSSRWFMLLSTSVLITPRYSATLASMSLTLLEAFTVLVRQLRYH